MEEEELLPPPPKKNATTVAVGEGELLPPPPKKKSEPTPEEKGVQSTSDLQTVSPQGGEQPSGSGAKDNEPVNLPKEYSAIDESSYKYLKDGQRYNLKKGGVSVIKKWDAASQQFVEEPLLDLAPKQVSKGFLEQAVTFTPKIETTEDVIARNAQKADEAANEAAKRATEIESLSNVPILQELNRLKQSGANENEIKKVADTPIDSKDIPSIRFQKGSEGQVLQNLNVNLPTEEYKGEVMDVPLSKLLPEDYGDVKTVGQLYDKIKQDATDLQDLTGQINQFNSVLREQQVSKLPQEDKDYLKSLEGTPQYQEELIKTLERNGSTDNLAMGFTLGLTNKLQNLYDLGDNIGLSNEQMAEKQRTELTKDRLFGVQPKGAAEITSMVGSFVPDIALGAISGGYGTMASMLSTMQREKLKEYYADQFAKGVKTPDQTKAWEYATTSTAKEVPLMMLAGKLSGVGGNVIGRNTMERAYELTKDVIKKASADAVMFGGLSGFSQNKINKLFDVAEHDDYIKSGLMYGLMGAGFGLVHGLKGGEKPKISQKTKNEVDYIASYLPDNISQNEINNLVKSGKMLPSEGEEVTQRMANYRQMRAQIPTEITFEQAEKIYPLWEEKTKLQSQMDGASGEFKKVLQGQLQDVDRKIMTKAAVPLSAEEKAQRSELIRKEAKGESIDKPLLKYLNDRYEAAKELKEAAKEEAKKAEEQKTETNDKENITWVSGEVGIGQEPIETQPIEEGGGGKIEGGGILEKAQEVTPTETTTETVAEIPKTDKEIVLFKGQIGKLNADGTRRTAHPNAEGFFATENEETAKRYSGEDNPQKITLPKDVTIEEVEVSDKNKPITEIRREEEKLINQSKAQVVKLKTIDAKGKEVQYIVKDKTLLSEKPIKQKIRSESLENGGMRYFAYDENGDIGSIDVEKVGDKIIIDNAFVEKDYQRKGIAKSLVEQIKKDFKAKDEDIEFGMAVSEEGAAFKEALGKKESVKEPQKAEPTEETAIFAEYNNARSDVARDKAINKLPEDMRKNALDVVSNFEDYLGRFKKLKEKGEIEFETDC